VSTIATALAHTTFAVATFVGKLGMASGDIPESYIFAKGYHHL